MKSSIIACFIFLLLIALAVLNAVTLNDIKGQIVLPLEAAEGFALEDDFERAAYEFGDAKRVWKDKSWLIEMTVNCASLYEASALFLKAEHALDNGDAYEFIKDSLLIRFCVEDCVNEQKLSLQNLF